MKTPDKADFTIFKRFRNQLNNELRHAKTRYNENYFASCANDSKQLWKKVNSLLNRTPNSQPITFINKNGLEISGQLLPDTFNDHFTENNDSVTSTDACRYIASECPETIFLRPTDVKELTVLFSQLSNSSACDADNLQIKPIKYVFDIIAPILTHIYNLYLSIGVFPLKMQKAKVLAVFKKGDRTKLSN